MTSCVSDDFLQAEDGSSLDYYGQRSGLRHARRVVIAYLDGPFGIGKTTAAREFVSAPHEFACYYISEPWRAWQNWISERNYIQEIYTTQKTRDASEISIEESSKNMCAAQMGIALPFKITHRLLNDIIGNLLGPRRPLGPRDSVILADRHPLAAYVCFPLARFIGGYITELDVLTLLGSLPTCQRGANMIITDLRLEELLSRITSRNRRHEEIQTSFVRILRNVYILLMNTYTYLRKTRKLCQSALKSLPFFRSSVLYQKVIAKDLYPIPEPSIEDTVFAVVKSKRMLNAQGIHTPLIFWSLEHIAHTIINTQMFYLSVDTLSPGEWAREIESLLGSAHSIMTANKNLRTAIEKIELYNRDMAVQENPTIS
ncbi:thymidine kinase [Psittacid alphaherpesvirus 5]|uniref:Thymidine kinase n=1 Tax=Psittacid alphaherpesvirus 5 TaxID=2972693 RepID=A0A5P9JSM4_9ALPH|nr:thymidine kinase [Psittacid alphaherpesvirus 5]QFU14560.1 thymidine kinase [Psittacid alphaherpesvirus 5]UOO01031.1 thymidine kinase [Psittacid alphaherpesvirus 5]